MSVNDQQTPQEKNLGFLNFVTKSQTMATPPTIPRVKWQPRNSSLHYNAEMIAR